MTSFGTYDDVTVDIENLIATVEIQRPPHNFFGRRSHSDSGAGLSRSRRRADVPRHHPCFERQGILRWRTAGQRLERLTDRRATWLRASLRGSCTTVQCTDPGGRGRSRGRRSEAASGSRCRPTSVSPVRKRASPPTSPVWAFTRASVSPSRYRPPSGSRRRSRCSTPVGVLKGEEALELGLCDYLVSLGELRNKATELALEIAHSAPLAIRSIRETMRGGLPQQIKTATDRELAEQDRLRTTDDFQEGVRAMA